MEYIQGRLVQLEDGRLVILVDEFEHASNNRYKRPQAHLKEGSKALWDSVVNNEGKVDFFTAKQFIESHAKGWFERNSEIKDSLKTEPLKALGFETVINLYDAMTERPMQDNSPYLDLLNQSIEISKQELNDWTQKVKEFWSSSNTDFIEKKWEQAKSDGLISKSEKSFAQTIQESFDNPQLISDGGYIRRKALLQFISNAYSDFVGEDYVQIELLQAAPALGGFHTVDERTGRHVIGINVANFAFQSNFQSIMNVLNHERYHASDRMLADEYNHGKISKGDSRYKRARIAAAAMSENGYISGDAVAGPLAYREQVIELGAHHAGKLAEYWTHETYAHVPDPVLSLRDDKEKIALSEEYRKMAERDVKVRYPEGLSPFRGMQSLPVFASPEYRSA